MPTVVSTNMDSNLYYNPNANNWMAEHLQTMRAIGKEQASRVGDPMFIDPENGNFGFQAGSPALAIGIEPLDATLMGRKDDFTVKSAPQPKESIDFNIWNQGKILNVIVPEEFENVTLSIYSPSGKTLAIYNHIAQHKSVTLPEFSEGMYLVQVTADKIQQTKIFYYSGN